MLTAADCLGAQWTGSGPNSDVCVEVARWGEDTLVRDSKDPEGPVLRLSAAEWANFEARIRANG